MKSRTGLVSNSSTSSFIMNAFLYSGIVSTPIIATVAYYKRESIKSFFKAIKNKISIKKMVTEKV